MSTAVIPLLESDSLWMFMTSPAISIITFYSSKHASYKIHINYLKDRMAQIINVNPWLTSTLKRIDNKFYASYLIDPCISAANIENSPFFNIIEDCVDLNSGMSFNDINLVLGSNEKYYKTIHVDNARQLVNSQKALFKLSFLQLPMFSGRLEFAIVLSMNHVLADGWTLYTLNEMLSHSKHVKALDCNRSVVADADIARMVPDMQQDKDMTMSFGYKYLCCYTIFLSLLVWIYDWLIRRRFGYEMRYVDIDALENEKLKYKSRTLWVSSNDIITSDFLSADAKCQYGIMAMNFRGRADMCTNSMAGNYENAIRYHREDFDSPLLIRKSVTLSDGVFRRAVSTGRFKPPRNPFLGMNMAIVTNWATFYTDDVEIPDAEFLHHHPLVSLGVPHPFSVAILFRPKKDKLAIFVNNSKVFDNVDYYLPENEKN